MNKEKFVLTFLAALGIIIGGYFFAERSDIAQQKEGGQQQTVGKLDMARPLVAPESGEGIVSSGSTYIPTDAKGNITRMIAQSMFLKMRQMDQSGTNPLGDLDMRDPQTRVMVEDTIRSVPDTIFTAAIDTKILHVTTDNTAAAKKRYLDGINLISKKYFSGSGADRFAMDSAQELIDNVQADCFGDAPSTKIAGLSKAYGDIFEAYKRLTVPSSWVVLHKLIAGYFKELSDIYGAFGACKEDPIRAYVGIDTLPEVYARATDIQAMLNEKAHELGLQ